MDTKKRNLSDIWESKFDYDKDNDTSVVDGEYILGRVVGPAFFPGRVSENNVQYTNELWEAVLADPELHKRLKDRLVLGTFGHDTSIDDASLIKGVASHIVTKMWIDEETKVGMAEYLILNTKAGRELNTLLRAGVKLRVSTKANGRLIENGAGKPRTADAKSYKFNRIDFVLDPGFESALPEVAESSGKTNKSNVIKESTMDETVKALLEQLQNMQTNISESKQDNGVLKGQITEMTKNVQDMASGLDAYKVLGSAEAISESLKTLESFSKLGTVEELSESAAKVAAYALLGSPEDISEALDSSLDTIKDLRETVTEQAREVSESLMSDEDVTELNEFRNLGSVDEVNESLDYLESYTGLGSTADIDESLDVLNAYSDLGSIDELNECVNALDESIEEARSDKVNEIADEFGVTTSIVESLLKANENCFEDVESQLSESFEISESRKSADASAPRKPGRQVKTSDFQAIEENKQAPTQRKQLSRAAQLMQR